MFNLEKQPRFSIKASMKSLLKVLFPPRPSFELHPETLALHQRLDTTTERLDAVLHRLRRGVSSKDKRSHLAVVADEK